MNYKLVSSKGSKIVTGTTLADAVHEAQAMDAELQPMFGVDVWTGGEKVAEVDGERIEDAFGEPLEE